MSSTLRLPVLPVVLLSLIAGSACRTAYYGALEQVGVHKRDILKSRVEDGREEQRAAQEQFQTTYERLVEVSGYDGGELERAYGRLESEFERSEARAEAVRERIASIEQVADDLWTEWETELAQYSNASLRRASEQQLRDTRARCERLVAAMERAERKMEPVLAAFRDQVLFLKHNLNARAVAALEAALGEIESDVAALIREMNASIREAESFLTTLES